MNILSTDLDHILKHTEGLWDELRGQNIFITGGTGFFGCWLLESLLYANEQLELGASITVLSRDPAAFLRKAPHLINKPLLTLYQGDIQNFEFPKGHFSHIIHAATDASAALNKNNPLLMFDTILEGTRRALDFAAFCGTKKFLYTSSGAVYGKQPPEMSHFPEEYSGAPDPLNLGSAYGEGKRAAEYLCAVYANRHQIECKIARCFAFVGPYLPLNIHFAIGNFILDGIRRNQIEVKSDGTSFRSYLYAADLAIWLWKILMNGKNCRPYNVGSMNSVTIKELADTIAGIFTPRLSIRINQALVPGKAPDRYVPSTLRAKKELGLEEKITLVEGIQRTISWYTEKKLEEVNNG